MEAIEAARDLLAEKARPAFEDEYKATCKRLWMPALDHLEDVLRTATGFEMPREVELLAGVLPYRASVPRERSQPFLGLVSAVEARRWAAHPWHH